MRHLHLALATGSILVPALASAADLPVKSSPVAEYVRVCSAFGSGFFYIPGTDSCLRVGGRVRAEVLAVEPLTRLNDTFGIRARGRLQIDHRTATDYGLLRTFIRMEITRSSGTPYGQEGTVGDSANLPQAYIQFAGLTAGQVTSFFSNPDLPVSHMGTLRYDDVPDVALFAYTYSFGNGASITLSAEDSIGRRQINSFTPLPGSLPLSYGGQAMPDLVANIRYAGTWGSAQLAGSVHQIREAGTGAGFATGRVLTETEYGFATSLQVGLNIPYFGNNDAAWTALSYADGALSYLGFGTYNAGTFGAGSVSTPVVDAYVDPFGEIRTARGYSVAGGFTHYWTPEFRSSLFGSFVRVEYSGPAAELGPLGNQIGLPDFDEWRVGGNTFWTPVSGLLIGGELIYVNADPKGRILALQTGFAGSQARLFGADSTLQGRLRIQRDF